MEKILRNRLIVGIIAAVAITAVLTVFFFCEKARKGTIKIGAVLSLSGTASSVGEEVRDGMLMAANEINLRGGVNKKNIELIIQDSHTDEKEAVAAFNRIETGHHPALYVSTLSSVAMALAPLAKKHEVVLMGLVATAPELTGQNKWVFRYFPTAKDEVPPILSILKELKVQNLGMLYLDSAYGRSFYELTRKDFEKAGGTLRGEIFKRKSTDFKAEINRLKHAEALYLVVNPGHYELIFQELKKQNYKGIIVGVGNVSTPRVRSLPEANGVYLVASIIYNPNFLYAREVRKKYEAVYGKQFNHYAASGYDIIKLLAGLLEDEKISRTGIKHLLEAGFIYPGIFGDLDVKPGDHDIHFPLHPARIVDGEVKYLR